MWADAPAASRRPRASAAKKILRRAGFRAGVPLLLLPTTDPRVYCSPGGLASQRFAAERAVRKRSGLRRRVEPRAGVRVIAHRREPGQALNELCLVGRRKPVAAAGSRVG